MINGVTQIVMTKADVLDAFEDLSMCTSYEVNGVSTKQVPFQMAKSTIVPMLEQFKGWKMDTTKIKEAADLPLKMQEYIKYINEYVGVPVKHVSNGPGRDQIVHL